MSQQILVLQHVEWAGPGRLLMDCSLQLDARFHLVRMWEQAAPDLADFDGLILLGGPAGTGDKMLRSLVGEEKRLLQAWLSLDKPCLGFNLGHLLLADAFRAGTGDNFMPDIGFHRGHLTHDGRQHPLFHGIDTPLLLFKWHDQAIQTPVPAEMVLLATSSHCVVEAFCIKGRPYLIGLQCDNYAAHPDDLGRWLSGCRATPSLPLPDRDTARKLIDQAGRHLAETTQTFTKLIKNFITLTDQATDHTTKDMISAADEAPP